MISLHSCKRFAPDDRSSPRIGDFLVATKYEDHLMIAPTSVALMDILRTLLAKTMRLSLLGLSRHVRLEKIWNMFVFTSSITGRFPKVRETSRTFQKIVCA